MEKEKSLSDLQTSEREKQLRGELEEGKKRADELQKLKEEQSKINETNTKKIRKTKR